MIDETRALARLPALDVAIARRRDEEAGAEEVTIALRARPSFAELATAIEANPFLLPWVAWARLVESAWAPWLRLPGTGPRD
jgi:hypothetical protein